MNILVLYCFDIDNLGLKFHIFQAISAILNCNMKAFTMLSLVFVIVAIAMIAKATGKPTSVPFYMSSYWFYFIINIESTNNDQSQTNYYFSDTQAWYECPKWIEKIGKCHEEQHSQRCQWHIGKRCSLARCCKKAGVPYKCFIQDVETETGCGEWLQQADECRKGNERKVCCEEKGVPDKCLVLCYYWRKNGLSRDIWFWKLGFEKFGYT